MAEYRSMDKSELLAEKEKLEKMYNDFKAKGPEVEHGPRQAWPAPDGPGYGSAEDGGITLRQTAPTPATTAILRGCTRPASCLAM